MEKDNYIIFEISDYYDRMELLAILRSNGYRAWFEYDKETKPYKVYIYVDKEKQ